MSILIISGSLRPGSRSRLLAQELKLSLEDLDAGTDWLDLRDTDLPLCDGDEAYNHPGLDELTERVKNADAIIVAVPIYNFDVNAAVKNLVELTGSAWEDKIVGFLCAAGGRSSYMSVMGFANSLMLDFRCLILPRFVYATKADFDGDKIINADVRHRIAQLALETVKLARFQHL